MAEKKSPYASSYYAYANRKSSSYQSYAAEKKLGDTAQKKWAEARKLKEQVVIYEKAADADWKEYLILKDEDPEAAEILKNRSYENRAKAEKMRADIERLNKEALQLATQQATIISPTPKTTTTKQKGTGDNQPKKETPYNGPYKYNIPLVKSAYFSSLPSNPQQLGNNYSVSTSHTYKDAATAWEEALGQGRGASRGAIQMDRILSTKAQKPTNAKAAKDYDNTMYGFRFLYNPSSVSMSWGLSTEVNWDYVSGGFDVATPLAQGLLQSDITFSLLLNRIEDMAYLDQDGLKIREYSSDDFGNLQRLVVNPYELQPPLQDLKDIYKKGTMYDVEYLFKTIMGKNATYQSTLNGRTADRGWLNGTPVELHLGNGLRYRVRISNMSISHALFNERMVPLLSTLNLTCTRFYDAPDYVFESGTSSSTTTDTTSKTDSKVAATKKTGKQ